MEKLEIATEFIGENRGPHTIDDCGFNAERTKKYKEGHPPIVVVEYDDAYGIVNGRHRTIAAKKANKKIIPAIVLTPDEFYDLEKKYVDFEEIEKSLKDSNGAEVTK